MLFSILDSGQLEINYEDSPTYPYIYTTIFSYEQVKEKILNHMDGWYINHPDEAEENFDDLLFDGSLNSAAELSTAIYNNANQLIEEESVQLYLAETILTAEEFINRTHKTMNIFEQRTFEDAVLRLVAAELWGKVSIPQLNNIQEGMVSTPRQTYLNKTAYDKLRRFKREKMVAI